MRFAPMGGFQGRVGLGGSSGNCTRTLVAGTDARPCAWGSRLGMQFAKLAARGLAVAIATAGLGLIGLHMASSHQSGAEMLSADLPTAADLGSDRDRRPADKGLVTGSPTLTRIVKADHDSE